jgi:ATP phosphoribosyltransferase
MTPANSSNPSPSVRLALPKGRIQAGVLDLLAAAGVSVHTGARGYRPSLSLPGFETKLLKPQNVVEMLGAGSRDLGFVGADWVEEKGVDLVELLDTGLDPVRVVAAAPSALLAAGRPPTGPLVVASEYERLTRQWMTRTGLEGSFVRTYGATEVFPPEDADVIVDNVATGATLAANGLEVFDEVLRSSTRLYASPEALALPAKRAAIEGLTLLLESVLAARTRAMLDLNVSPADVERVVEILPCLDRPTIAGLAGQEGFAVRAAVLRSELPQLVQALKARGASDLVVTSPEQIVR